MRDFSLWIINLVLSVFFIICVVYLLVSRYSADSNLCLDPSSVTCKDYCPKVVQPLPEVSSPPACPDPSAEICRNKVFSARGVVIGELSREGVEKLCTKHLTFDVCKDIKKFTGLSDDEVMNRMQRKNNFHFTGEHLFWNPQSKSELSWYYSTSVSYLFANSLHEPRGLRALEKGIHEPVLDYSGGVGNTVLHLVEDLNMTCQYFGIGLVEKAFAEYRFRSRGHLADSGSGKPKVEIKSPWAANTDWNFDPILGGLPGDSSLGSIIATDVLEHIPNYERVVQRMVDSIRVGGVIVESTPFGKPTGNADDLRIHVSDGGITMEQAMGSRMKKDTDKTSPRSKRSWWVKIKE